MDLLTRRMFAGLLAGAVLRGQGSDARTDEQLYEARDWFGLSRRVKPGSRLLHRAAAATAFHRVREADRLLKQVIRAGGPDADEAHNHLINLLMRQGKFGEALREARVGLKRTPDKEDLVNAEALFTGLAGFPAMRLRRLRAAKLAAADDGMDCAIAINGRAARYFWDTGANFCIITENEARRLGMRVVDSSAKVGNSAGGNVGFRIALAAKLEIGECVVENVPFLVFSDDQQPFNLVPQEERGGIGLPVQLLLGGFRWTPRMGAMPASMEFGVPPLPPREPNLCFDGLLPVTEFAFRGERLPAHLDSGATNTDLWPPFAARYPDLVASGHRQKRTVGGVGQSVDLDAVVVDRLALELAGKPVTLAPADIYLEKTQGNSERYYANLGIDLLRQAAAVTIDFRSMRLLLG